MIALRPGQRVEIVGPTESGSLTSVGMIGAVGRGRVERGALFINGAGWVPVTSLRPLPQHETDRFLIRINLAALAPEAQQ